MLGQSVIHEWKRISDIRGRVVTLIVRRELRVMLASQAFLARAVQWFKKWNIYTKRPSSEYHVFYHFQGMFQTKLNLKKIWLSPWIEPRTTRFRQEHSNYGLPQTSIILQLYC